MSEHGTYAALAALRGGAVEAEAWTSMLDVIDAREDCADFRMLVVLRLLVGGVEPPPQIAERVHRSVLGFRWWMSEPGTDSMCFWSENHQLIFATAELLAGRRFPGQVFTNDGRLGAEHAAAARTRLVRWLRLRQRFGFSEWLSPVYYEEDVAALVVLADHAGDPELEALAAGVLDLLLLDCALHTWQGVFSPSAGRVYEGQKTDPCTAEMQLVVASAFGAQPEPRWNQLGMLFVLRERYRVPEVLREIARSEAPVTVRSGHGLDVAEAVGVFRDRLDPETTGALLWSMEAFVSPGSVAATMAAYERWHLDDNRFLSGLRALQRVPRRLLPTLVRALRPVVSGTALQRADVVTRRGVSYAISSAQHYQVGGFGDQQHLWQALLPGGVAVFATHPGSALVGDESRNSTPGAWVGNGVNPDVGQDGSVVLALHDTRGRRGFGEKRRVRGSHLYVPTARLTTHLAGDDWLVLGAGGGLLGVRSTGRLVRSGDAYEQAGSVTAWLVIGAELADHGSPEAFRDWLRGCRVRLRRSVPGRASVTAETPGGVYELGRGRLRRDGTELPGRAGRYASPWVTAPDDPYEIVVEGKTGRLVLDRRGRRQ